MEVSVLKTLIFYINHPGEEEAGMRPFSDEIRITVESGEPGGAKGEFTEFMRQSLSDWYDGASVSEEKN